MYSVLVKFFQCQNMVNCLVDGFVVVFIGVYVFYVYVFMVI